MIIATAGHVDHGKTLLVKALTGVDADRLPEEKRRGMTIDLGFAYLPIDGAPSIGFVDVPGHERFLHNMLCGVTGIDFVLLIVAADDGPMPQTVEHLAVLDLLGVHRGAVVMTKIDRVSAARLDEVQGQIGTLLAATTLAGSPVFPVSAVTGEGIEALKAHLFAVDKCTAKPSMGSFRMAVDRSFHIAGAGLVVTGTAVSGSLSAGGQIALLEHGASARVRGIHAQNTPSESCHAGQRCALNLTGVGLRGDTAIRRGDWVVTGDVPAPVTKFDARLRILASEAHPFAHWTPVHVHLGASDVTGRVAILENDRISPGSSALVQIVLDRSIGALYGDRFILRDQSAQRTIGGGPVIDVYPPRRGRAKPERLAFLAAMECGSTETALADLLDCSPQGISLSRFSANRNLTAQEAIEFFGRVPMKAVMTPSGALGFSRTHWASLKKGVVDALTAWHTRSPHTIGPAEDRVFTEAGIRLPREVALAIVAELEQERVIVREPYGVRLPWHAPKLKPADASLWRKVAPLLEKTPLRPPTLHEIADLIGEDRQKTESLLVRSSRLGLIVRVADNRFFMPEAVRRLGMIAEAVAAENPGQLVAAAAFRDRAGVGRNVTIELLDYFVRVKFTRRVGPAHQLLRPAAEMFAARNHESVALTEEKRSPVGRTDFKSAERR